MLRGTLVILHFECRVRASEYYRKSHWRLSSKERNDLVTMNASLDKSANSTSAKCAGVGTHCLHTRFPFGENTDSLTFCRDSGILQVNKIIKVPLKKCW